MSRLIVAIGLSAALTGCAGISADSTHVQLEKAETVAEDAYVAAVPFMTVSQQQIAWADLQKVRTAYNLGQDITALVTILLADIPKAK